MNVCMHVCIMYVCMYVHLYLSLQIYVWMHVCMYIYIYRPTEGRPDAGATPGRRGRGGGGRAEEPAGRSAPFSDSLGFEGLGFRV